MLSQKRLLTKNMLNPSGEYHQIKFCINGFKQSSIFCLLFAVILYGCLIFADNILKNPDLEKGAYFGFMLGCALNIRNEILNIVGGSVHGDTDHNSRIESLYCIAGMIFYTFGSIFFISL